MEHPYAAKKQKTTGTCAAKNCRKPVNSSRNKKYCSHRCYVSSIKKADVVCDYCLAIIKDPRPNQKYCSAQCYHNACRKDDSLSYEHYIRYDRKKDVYTRYKKKPREDWGGLDWWNWLCDSLHDKGIAYERIKNLKTRTMLKTIRENLRRGDGTSGYSIEEFLGVIQNFERNVVAYRKKYKWGDDCVISIGMLLSYWHTFYAHTYGLEEIKPIKKIVEAERVKRTHRKVYVDQWWLIDRKEWSATTLWCYINDHLEKANIRCLDRLNSRDRSRLNELQETFGKKDVVGVVFHLPNVFLNVFERFDLTLPFNASTFCNLYKGIRYVVSKCFPDYTLRANGVDGYDDDSHVERNLTVKEKETEIYGIDYDNEEEW